MGYSAEVPRSHNSLGVLWSEISDRGRLLAGWINHHRYLSSLVVASSGLTIYSAILTINTTRDFNELKERMDKRKDNGVAVLPTRAQSIALKLREHSDQLRTVLTVPAGRIQVEVEEGINVRNSSSVEDGARLLTGLDEPVYRVERRTGQPVDGIIENYVLQWNKYDPKKIDRIWAVRWVDDGEDNGGVGHPEFMAVSDVNDGGCFVTFTNPNAEMCRLEGQDVQTSRN